MPEASKCGWALSLVGWPCVAQRVWLMPISPGAAVALDQIGQSLDAPGTFAGQELAIGDGGEAGRVVAAVLEPAQAIEEDGAPPARGPM